MFRMVHQFLIYLFGNPCKSDVRSVPMAPNGNWRSVTLQETELTPAVLKFASVQNPGSLSPCYV